LTISDVPVTGKRIFISYAREDQSAASALADALESRSVTVWWDTKLIAGHNFRDSLLDEINRADAVVVLWSEYSIRSGFVIDEASEGRRQEKLIPISIDGTGPPWGFGDLHTINYSDRLHDDVDLIMDAIRQIDEGSRKPPSASPYRLIGDTNPQNEDDHQLDYVEYHSDVLGLTFAYPSALLTLDTSRFTEGIFEFVSLENQTEATLLMSSVPDHGDIRHGRETEESLLRSRGCRCTYIAPQKEENWSNWYVLSGIGPDGKRFYCRRWYTDRGMISFEFNFDGARIPIYNHVITEMTINRLTFDD
jgi:hypothetical protein